MEEEVAAVEDDEVDHRGPVKIGGVLWVVSHRSVPGMFVITQFDCTNRSDLLFFSLKAGALDPR